MPDGRIMYRIITMLMCVIVPSYQMNEGKLASHLLKDMCPFARPVNNISHAVVVTFGFELVHIVSIVESKQTITEKVWLRMSWVNEFLQWEPREWGNVTKTRLHSDKVWTPDIYLQEDVSPDMATGPEKYKTQVVINYNGLSSWYVPTLFQSSCIFNVASFPFDKQQCTLVFTPWTHDQSEIDLKVDPKPVVTSNYINSSEWDLMYVDKRLRSTKYACCANPFVDISYTLHLKRKPLYYIYSVIVPCIIQMLIILFTFFLPPDSGERIGVVITVLLVFAVYLEVLSHTLPRTSTSTPALSRFYIAAMAESACSLIATCVVLIVHFKGTEKGVLPMPAWAKTYLLDGIGAYLLVRRNRRELDDEGLATLEKKGSYTGLNNHEENNKNYKLDVDIGGRGHNNKLPLDTLVEEVRVITSLIQDQNRQDEIEEEWQVLGKVMDRIFFLVFLVIFVCSSLILLLPVYNE